MRTFRYRFWRWLAPRLFWRTDWAWGRKWRLWHDLYGPHINLWDMEG